MGQENGLLFLSFTKTLANVLYPLALKERNGWVIIFPQCEILIRINKHQRAILKIECNSQITLVLLLILVHQSLVLCRRLVFIIHSIVMTLNTSSVCKRILLCHNSFLSFYCLQLQSDCSWTVTEWCSTCLFSCVFLHLVQFLQL